MILAGNGWEWGNGIVINFYYGSFPHSLLSTDSQVETTIVHLAPSGYWRAPEKTGMLRCLARMVSDFESPKTSKMCPQLWEIP